MTTVPISHKVVAYITHGSRLLVFEHVDFPEAGIQVPAGTIHQDEAPETAVLREAQEETGLPNLTLRHYLGRANVDMRSFGKNEQQVRHYFHLLAEGDVPQTWEHDERFADDGSPPLKFRLYWVDYPAEVPDLAGAQGMLLSMLDEYL